MAWKPKTLKVNLPTKTCNPAGDNEEKSPEIVAFLSKVDKLLQEGHPENALELFSRNKLKSPWITNANGVCLLRLDRAQEAVNLFRSLALSSGSVVLRVDAPTVFKTNFTTALLAYNNLGGCLKVLHEINNEENPLVQQLRAAIQRFKVSLSLWTRLQWRMGIPPDGPIAMDFPLGNLE
jgi:hypothetical protein